MCSSDLKGIPAAVYDGVRAATLVLERGVKRSIRREFTGGKEWRASWTGRVANVPGGVVGIVGSAHPASRIQELGGVVRPKRRRALTIPLTRLAKNSRARDFTDLFVLKTDNHAFLAQSTAGGGLVLHYLLSKRVVIKATHYLTKAMKTNEKKIVALVGGRVLVQVGDAG